VGKTLGIGTENRIRDPGPQEPKDEVFGSFADYFGVGGIFDPMGFASDPGN
jgi:hypothetical protein